MRPPCALLAAACLLGLAGLAAGTQALVCDGKLHNITMPSAPYPAGVPWAPITNQQDFTCTRARRSSGLQCGGARRFSCGTHVFEPVTFGSGATPGIISPSNPVIFSLIDGSAKAFSYLQWTAVDVGTAGARLEGVYSPESGLANAVATHEWVPNGAISLPDGKKLFGPCTNCEMDAGIKVLSVSALPGAGFRAMELSQKYVDTRCEGSGVNDDGIYWAGMTYACVQPTCGDTDLDKPGQQRFAGCTGSWVYNPSADDETTISQRTCCIWSANSKCSDIDPAKPGTKFSCPDGYQYDPSKDGTSPATTDNCCKAATCDDVLPVTHKNTPYKCPAGTEYDPSAGNKAPSDEACCTPATCSNISPIKRPFTPFTCPSGYTFSPEMATSTPPSTELCCKRISCGDVDPANKPNTAFTCPAGSDFDPSQAGASPPSESVCCKQGTCGNTSPITAPGTKFSCPDGHQFDPSKADTMPPSTTNCCKQGTCDDTRPIDKPNTPFSCPKDTEYDPSMGNAHPPSEATCCVAGTCGNIFPVSNRNTAYKCPNGFVYNPAMANWPASDENCCRAFRPTCGNVDASNTGQIFDCANWIYNASASSEPADFFTCCFNPESFGQASVDVYIKKTVAPALANDAHTSQTREVGAVFTFTLTAGLNSLTAADNVEVVDNLPAGLELLSVQDADGACDYTLKQIKCNWKRLAPTDKKVIKVQVKAVTAGTHTNPAFVTTTSNDTNPDNDRDQAKAIVKGACCIKSTSTATCDNVLPAACIGGEFNPKATCDGSTCIPLPPQVGACCIPELGRCKERVARSQCMGTWFNQRVCSQITCAVPTGACCNPDTGACSEGVAKDACPGAATNWRGGGKCADGFCSGACCAADKGTCSQQLKKNCMPPSTWTLYKECDANTCPSPDITPVCIPKWYKCSPARNGTSDACCDGYECTYTYKDCAAGSYVCKPTRQCVDEGGICGGHSGGCCCTGSCRWDYASRQGRCSSAPRCIPHNRSCHKGSTDCCPGSRCVRGRCSTATYDKCKRKCSSYECVQERKKDCDCFYASAAASKRR